MAQFTALYDADVANYKQVILTAFQQTEDTSRPCTSSPKKLSRNKRPSRPHSARRCRVCAYKTGLDPYLNVFTAQAILLANQQTLITLRAQQMTSSVQLIESLGGGWDVTQLPTERQAQANGRDWFRRAQEI